MIILRHAPKEKVRIDLTRFPIRGGFRGFQNVPPGVHYVSVLDDGQEVGEWLYLQPGVVLVRVYDALSSRFKDDTPESTAELTNLALSGVMNSSLINYPLDKASDWLTLTSSIGPANFPPALHEEDGASSGRSRFEKALTQTHSGDSKAFLAEFQFAFLRWLVDCEDAVAYERWQHLLLSLYNAGESDISDNPALFEQVAAILLAQFALLPNGFFTPSSFVRAQVSYLIEDMCDTGIAELVAKAAALNAYLQQRTQGV